MPDYDAGKSHYNLRYEYLQSAGPSASETFNDRDGNIGSLSDGKWKVLNDKTEEASGEDWMREYLIITRWDYNPYTDELSPAMEYIINRPAVR